MQEQLQKLMSTHAALSLEVKALGDRLVDALALVEGMGHQINLLSTLAETPSNGPAPAICYNWTSVQWPPIPVGSRVRLDHGEFYTKTGIVTEDAGPYCRIDVDGKRTELGKRWLSVLVAAPVAEMAVHAPSEIPPVRQCATDCVLVESHDGSCMNGDGADIATMLSDDNVVDPVPGENIFGERVDDLDKPLPHLGGRKKTEYTAREWAESMHFLNYMKKPVFASWNAEAQNTIRDEFVAAQPPDLKMNRWGARFSKFCGVT